MRRLISSLSPKKISAGYLLVLLIVVYSLLRPDTFPTRTTVTALLSDQALTALVAVGVLFPLAAGLFDLSVGGAMALASVISASLAAQHGQNTVTAIAVAILIGAAGGAFVGILVTRIHINSIISTVAMGSILTALANAVSNQQDIIGLPNAFTKLGAAQWFGIQTEVWIVFVIVIGLWFVLEHTPMGRQLFAVGGNIEAARLNGLRVDRLRIISLVIGSTCAAGAGVLATAAVTSGSSQIGPAYLLPAYAAAFLGATQIKPGRVNVWGTVLAVITLAVGVTGLQLLGAAEWVSDFFDGAALLVAVGLANNDLNGLRRHMRWRLSRGASTPGVAIPAGVEALVSEVATPVSLAGNHRKSTVSGDPT